ncbi:hypothetical protein [Streptomyces sp. DSS69]|uniref:hypothetical protein n=1 Tax=unclassified Streptomyces TaxID=2593676 RepID=UPI0031F9A747
MDFFDAAAFFAGVFRRATDDDAAAEAAAAEHKIIRHLGHSAATRTDRRALTPNSF